MEITITSNTLFIGCKNDRFIDDCLSLGVRSLRVNLSKLSLLDDLYRYAEECRRIKEKHGISLMIDLPIPRRKPRVFFGSSINSKVVHFSEGEVVCIKHKISDGIYTDSDKLNTVETGGIVCNSAGNRILKVINQLYGGTELEFLCDYDLNFAEALFFGELTENTSADIIMTEIANDVMPEKIALSFVECPDDVLRFKNKLSFTPEIISKIESYAAFNELESIAEESSLMVARGDLLHYADPLLLPVYQKTICNAAKKSGAKCYIATGILSTLTKGDLPSAADICDLHNILNLHPEGIVINYGVSSTRLNKALQIINTVRDRYV